MEKSILEVQELSFSYRKDHPVLEKCSFQLKRGTKNVLLGSNGAGKSTLFFLLNGVYQPKAGAISLDKKSYAYDRGGIRDIRKKVGLVFQDPDVQLFASTVLDDVIFGPMNLGMTLKDAEEKAREALKAVGLEGREDDPPHMLSHGQKKRVAIAGVLAMDPEMILMDEPTAGLDYEGTKALNSLIDELASQGRTLFIATHEVDWALGWADQAFVLHDGKIADFGEPRRILNLENHEELGFGRPIICQTLSHLSELMDQDLIPRTGKELAEWIRNQK